MLGAAGNNQDFTPYLDALGAAKGNTNIFAAVAFAPITDLDAADKAYEWNFNSVKTYTPMSMEKGMLPQATLGASTNLSATTNSSIATNSTTLAGTAAMLHK